MLELKIGLAEVLTILIATLVLISILIAYFWRKFHCDRKYGRLSLSREIVTPIITVFLASSAGLAIAFIIVILKFYK